MNPNSSRIIMAPDEEGCETKPTWSGWRSRFPRPTLKEWIVRLIAAYLAVLSAQLLPNGGLSFTNKAFGASLTATAFYTLALFLLFTLIDCFIGRLIRPDGWLLLAATIGYGTLLAFRANATMTAVAITLLVCFTVAFLIHSDMLSLKMLARNRREDGEAEDAMSEMEGEMLDLPRWAAFAMVGICFALCALYIGAITVIRYLNYVTPNFDFGLFVNMFHNMATTGLPNITSERDGFLSHFAVHFSPIYYLLLPAYLIFPSGITLQIGQAVVVASGVFPLYRIVRGRGLSRLTAIAFCAIYVLFPALSGSCMYDLHENCFLAPLLLWTFDAALRDKRWLTLLFALLTCFVKEDAPVYIAFFGLYLLCSSDKLPRENKGRRAFGILVFLLAVAYFLCVSAYLAVFGEGVMAWRYEEYSADGGLLSVITTVIRNPGLVLHKIFVEDKLTYLFQTIVPLIALPFMTTLPSRLILLGPYLLINLMPSYVYQHDIYFQYNFGTFAFLILAAVLNFADFKPQNRKTALACAVCASLIMFSGTTYSAKNYYFKNYDANADTRAEMAEALAVIPDDAIVTSSTFLLAHIAYRDEIYPITTKHVERCEWAAIDLRYGKEIKKNPYGSNDFAWFRAKGWELVHITEGTVAIFRNPNPKTES